MMNNNNIKLIIAGGGTGGHIFPAIAIANAVKNRQALSDILFVGAKGKMEMEKVPAAGYKIIGLDIAGFNRSHLLKNIFLPFKVMKSFLQAKKVLQDFKPNVVVGVGGYASFPMVYMAQRNGIPTLLQEQNSFAGKSNKILGKKANAICVAYDGMERFFAKEKIVNTGNPVRKNITENHISKEQALDFFQLKSNQKIVFVFGGSLGAKSINEAIEAQVKTILESGAQLIWQTGEAFVERAKNAIKGYEHVAKVFPFIREMDYAYVAADIIVARAGASSIAELCIVAKPVIFVPFPFASEDHQMHNAMSLAKHHAAIVVKDSDAKAELVSKIISLLHDEKARELMIQHIKPLAIKDADQNIANKIFEIAN